MLSGIYIIEHKDSGRSYIGSSVNMQHRWNQHRRSLVSGAHHSIYLQRMWNKYGEEAFIFRPLLLCNKANLLFYEQLCLDGLNPALNASPTAGSPLGVKHTEKSRANIRAALIKSIEENPERLKKFVESGPAAMKRLMADPEKRQRHIDRLVKMAKTKNTRLFTHNGKTQSITAWEQELGLPPHVLNKRINTCGMSFEEAIKLPLKIKNKPIEYNGETHTITEWANKLGISVPGLKDRINRHGLEIALSKKYTDKFNADDVREKMKRMGKPIYMYNGKEHTCSELARVLGAKTGTLHAYLKTHSLEETLAHYTKKQKEVA